MKPKLLLLSDDKRQYDAKLLKKKFDEKECLQVKYWLKKDKTVFTVWITLPLTLGNWSDELIDAINWCLNLGMHVVLLASAEKEFQVIIEEFQRKHVGKIAVLSDELESEADIYALSDICLFLEMDINKIKSCLSYWCVPVCFQDKVPIIQNFDPLLEKWNWYILTKKDVWHLIEGVLRAKETYRFPYDWETLKARCVETVL